MGEFDIMQVKKEYEVEVSTAPKTVALVEGLKDIKNPMELAKFGDKAAEEIAKCSDELLKKTDTELVEKSTDMIKNLTTVMGRFDYKELDPEYKPTFSDKAMAFLGKAKRNLGEIVGKYETMGGEVDKIGVQLKSFEYDIENSNKELEKLFQANMQYFGELKYYIEAGSQGAMILDEKLQAMRKEVEETGNTELQIMATDLEQAKQVLEQRVMDLRMAENVALQTIPMIKGMQSTNIGLSRKINASFITTLPIFKSQLVTAINLKRQGLTQQAIDALDKATNDMLTRNATMVVEQTKKTAEMVNSSGIKMETLETTWKTIMEGIKETQRIQQEAASKRKEDTLRLEKMKDEYKDVFMSISKAEVPQIEGN